MEIIGTPAFPLNLILSVPVPHASVDVDAGLLAFAVLSDGAVINNPMHLRKAEKKLIRKQRRLSTTWDCEVGISFN